MRYVFLIGAEHQLPQVDFAIDHFNISFEEIILFIQDVNSDNKLYAQIIKVNNYSQVYSFPNWTFKEILAFSKKTRYYIDLCKSINYEDTMFFSSQYSDDSTLLFLSILKPLKFYLMDEGTASYTVLEKRKVFDLKFKLKTILKSILYRIPIGKPQEIVYFTKFNFTPGFPDKIEKYSIPKADNQVTSYTKQFAFLGSSVVELDIMNADDYLFYLSEIKANNQNSELLYIKHRKEKESKLSRIQQLGYNIIDLDCPFEKYFASQTMVPQTLGSFFTTSVLINISENFMNVPNLNIYIFPIEKLKAQQKVFENILRFLEKNPDLNFINL